MTTWQVPSHHPSFPFGEHVIVRHCNASGVTKLRRAVVAEVPATPDTPYTVCYEHVITRVLMPCRCSMMRRAGTTGRTTFRTHSSLVTCACPCIQRGSRCARGVCWCDIA